MIPSTLPKPPKFPTTREQIHLSQQLHSNSINRHYRPRQFTPTKLSKTPKIRENHLHSLQPRHFETRPSTLTKPPKYPTKPPKNTKQNHNSLKLHTTSIAKKPKTLKPIEQKNPHSLQFYPASIAKFPKPLNPRSLPLHSKNPTTIYKDIKTLSRKQKLKQALTVLDYATKFGIPINPTAFSSLITACTMAKDLQAGRHAHAHLRASGLADNEFLRVRLVRMYAACGAPEDARTLLSLLPLSTPHAWNALLRGAVVRGGRRMQDALALLPQMLKAGASPDEYTLTSLIKVCAGAPALGQGVRLHAHAVKSGWAECRFVLTALMDLYFKCGNVMLACKVFDEIGDRDLVAWCAMVAGFAHNGLRREALGVFRAMQFDGAVVPNSAAITMVLPICGDMVALRLGKEVHGFAIRRVGYAQQEFVKAGLIDMYCKCADMGSARRVFYGHKERGLVMWTALMSGYARTAAPIQALRALSWMQQEGLRPDLVALMTALPVCAKLNALRPGKELHAYALRQGFFPNVSLTTALMVLYSQCGTPRTAHLLFESMERRSVVVWTVMAGSYMDNGQPEEALAVFRAMHRSSHRPDSVAMARALEVCGVSGHEILGREAHAQVLKKALESVPFVSKALINMYGKCNQVGLAKLVFETLSSKGLITWTAIIEAHGVNERYGEAMQLFGRMEFEGLRPNKFTFGVVLSMCDRAGLASEALRFFESMTKKYGLGASAEDCERMVGLMNRVGSINEAQRFERLRLALG
ncbi:hypothetical protein AMTR_s00182p00046810 [Amborella trichopoda]|uniref:Pentacotripeptide-repeat region of PRORP domain-containing protein n=2 Tax=Amborella trichopoda TaxID=13333 RepID=U5D4J0_AMBTC|nr:hypothetical protein AMTR_s00182p00046810 [Amborella trichopoda]